MSSEGTSDDKRTRIIEPAKVGEFRIVMVTNDYWMDFECKKVIAMAGKHCPGMDKQGELLYDEEGHSSSPNLTSDYSKARIHMRGFLKWDGCMEVHRENIHYCGLDDIEMEYNCIKGIRDVARTELYDFNLYEDGT